MFLELNIDKKCSFETEMILAKLNDSLWQRAYLGKVFGDTDSIAQTAGGEEWLEVLC